MIQNLGYSSLLALLLLAMFWSSQLSAQEYYNSSEFKHFDGERKKHTYADSTAILKFVKSWDKKARESGDSMAMAYVWMDGGYLLFDLQQRDMLLGYLLDAQGVIERHDLRGTFLRNRRFIATAYLDRGNYSMAIEQGLKSIDEIHEYDPYYNRNNYRTLADSYLEIRNYERMDYYCQKWYDLVSEKQVRMDLGFAIFNIQESYELAGMYEKASLYEDKFYVFYQENSELLSRVPAHAFMSVRGETPQEKIDKLNKYLPYHIMNGRSHLVSRTNRQLGHQYLAIKDAPSAVAAFRKAVENSDDVIFENKLDALRGLSQAYKETGQHELALDYMGKYVIQLDSFKDQQVIAQANELETKYENGKKELQLEMQESQIASKNRWLQFSAGAGIIVACLASFIYLLYRRLRRSNRKLSEILSEKETLLKEIHHRVKNNLQVISSLLSLQSKYVKDETAVSALNEGQNRVESMALIHQNLYREDNVTGVNMRNYIPLLADNIFSTYNINGERIKIAYDIDDITLDVSTVIPIGLVINELISNALKYAFVGKEEGTVTVKLQEDSELLSLEISDNGIGPQETEDGFGTKLIKSFTRKLEGDLEVVSDDGTCVRITIKNYKRA